MKLMRLFLIVSVAFLGGIAFGAEPGQKVDDLTFTDLSGKSHKLSDYAGSKAVVLVFLSTRCPVSNAYDGRVKKLAAAYSGKGVTFIAINSDRRETVDEIRKHASKAGFSFSVMKDKDGSIARALGATVTPEAIVLAGDRTVLYQGRIDDSQRESHVKRKDLGRTLDEVLAGKAVTNAKTKSFGCRIKAAR